MSEPLANPFWEQATSVPEITATIPPPVHAEPCGQIGQTGLGGGIRQAAPSSSRPPRTRVQEPLEPLEDVVHRRITRIKEGDSVLLRMPSDAIKAVVASKDGLVQLGKFGAFPASQLLGLYYDITYEIVPSPNPTTSTSSEIKPVESSAGGEGSTTPQPSFGQKKGKKAKNYKGKNRNLRDGEGEGEGHGATTSQVRSNPGWANVLRPLKRKPIVEAVIDDIQETNEFIDDTETAKAALLTQEEIIELRAQGVSAEEMMQKQIERHERFGLKTDFSKDKWRKRKEKKQTVLPLAPSIPNITSHYLSRSPQSILHLREDTLSQLLVMANIRPGGRYLVVDDTGGLITAAILDRMGCQGRILTFVDADSPPAWGVLGVTNLSDRELECVKWLNWMEAEEGYERPAPPPEEGMPGIAAQKTLARMRRHNAQVAELNATRDELHMGNWDGLILATDLSPISVLSRLTRYVIGSGTVTVYSPHLQVLAEVLQWTKRDPSYLGGTLTESWTRTYQVLPGRTHPTMATSATGGYLFHATRVHPAHFDPESHHRAKRRKASQAKKTTAENGSGEGKRDGGQNDEGGEMSGLDDEEIEEVLVREEA